MCNFKLPVVTNGRYCRKDSEFGLSDLRDFVAEESVSLVHELANDGKNETTDADVEKLEIGFQEIQSLAIRK